MKLIVGLGNPGRKYTGTRHNVGFEVLDELARQNALGEPRDKFDGRVAQTDLVGHSALLVWPQTYMNASGRCVRAVSDFYKIPAENIIVVCDDFHLPLGKIRLRMQGSSGGQKGLQDTINQLGTDEFCRLRIGVGPVPDRWDVIDFVLGRFLSSERDVADDAIAQATSAIRTWIAEGPARAMNEYN